MILILAGNYLQADRYAQDNGVANYKYVFGPHTMHIEKAIKEIHFTGTWSARKDLQYIQECVKRYNIKKVVDAEKEGRS